MQKRVVVGADQEVTNEDFTRLGLWPQEGDDAIVRDFLLSGRGYTGFVVTPNGSTAVDISAGRLYDGGSQYGSDEAQNLSLAEFVPFTAGQKVIVRLVVQGREDDGYEEARNNEREVPTAGGGTVVQRVPDTKARARVRNAIVATIPGAPSSVPVAPATPVNTVAIADILIGTGGVETITRREENEAPELDALSRAFAAQQEQIDLMAQAIGGIRNDLAALGRELRNSASGATIAAVVTDVSSIKDRLAIPDTGTPYGADHFLDESESDPGNVDYAARVEDGLRFPYANFWRGPIALLNPNDPNFMHAAQGIICPKYTAVDGVLVSKQASTMALGGTTYQTMELKQLTMSRQSVRYGDYFTVCENSNWWNSGRYDAATNTFTIDGQTYELAGVVRNNWWMGHRTFRLRRFWTDTVSFPYDVYAPVTHQIQGVIKAQTFIQSQDRWSPGAKLGIVSGGAGAQVTATLVECNADGSPNPGAMLAKTTLDLAQFSAWPAFTRFPWSKPVFLQKGLYAVLFATTGDVTIATAEGQDFLGGTLFESTDGAFFAGDLTKDMCFGVEYCRFDLTHLPVQLAGLNLDGGVHNIAIVAGMIVPTNADAAWQLQVAGVWRDIGPTGADGETLFGSGVTPFYDFRAHLSGNEWAMPIIDMAASQVTLFRAATSLDHISGPIQMAAGVTVSTVHVKAIVENWEDARHTLVAKLRYGAGYASLKTHSAVVTKGVVNRPDAREIKWTFDFTPAIDAFKVEFLGTTNNARVTYHVEGRFHDAA
jgi:hypothetical protein